ncbi:MAG: isoprenyl transferase [Balneola sp.]|nr:isoprenyl transferase [Balneola sp.]MBO6651383.1 isoprenyl transferase [Balneola sp.]MBO6710990.1 isoprenyl transferase [Balneola sp.]MBO6801506.1 isoprenyl transferase [Balneola sp.]MBO6870410.1 isoprenyl transferase [Balneola sp.]
MKKLTLTNTEQTKADQEKQLELKKSGEIPEHIAIIMDGNGRWARSKGSIRLHGHKVGVDSVRDITESCAQLGVKYLTLYAFSTENWGRPSAEVRGLMRLLVSSLRKEADNLHENNIRLVTIGQTDRFPEDCKKQLKEAIELTEDNDRLQLCLALSYSGRWDITEAVKKIATHVKEGRLDPTLINDQMIADHLSTAEVPDPDLIIRTSGEYRISNFLLWQLAYSELYITEQFWPDFRREELYKAIDSYQSRDRRFGKVKKSEDEKGLAARLLKNKNK